MANDVEYHAETIVPANGMQIAYDAFGSRDDPPLLLIGGLGNQLVSWAEGFCRQLAAAGCWVIRYDFRDVGHSTSFGDLPAPGLPRLVHAFIWNRQLDLPYTVDDLADDAAALLSAIGAGPAHIVGISLGGIIACALAERHPHALRSLTVMMSTGVPPYGTLPRLGAFVLFRKSPDGREAYLDHSVKVRWALSGDGYPPDEPFCREMAAISYDRARDRRGVARQLAAVFASLKGIGARLPTITAPTLVIHGRQDPLIRVDNAARTAAAIPGASLLIIDGLGHEIPPASWDQLCAAIAAHVGS